MNIEEFVVAEWPEPVKRRVAPILQALLNDPEPVQWCDHIDYCIGAAFTCAVDFDEIGLVCAECIRAHLLLVDRFEVDVCEACAHKGRLTTHTHDSAIVEVPFVPPRIEWLEHDDQRFWQGHLTICNAWAVCETCKEAMRSSAGL